MSGDSGRYAVYFAPEPGSALARFGAAWLGYDVATGARPEQPVIAAATPARVYEITAEPRQYGFHATLKPPFALAAGRGPAELDQAVSAVAASFPAFAAPKLRLASLSGFWALLLAVPSPEIERLAAVCVADLDGFRAPPAAAELARRRRAGLSPGQETLLERWGYPYVMDEFRFHMTLTARLDPAEGAAISRDLMPLVAPVCEEELAVDAISLFHQDRRDAPFRLWRRYQLAG